MKECLQYEADESGTITCHTCSHECTIKKDRVGICGVRKNVEGKLQLLVYGKAIAVHTDPIEKKPLFHFLPGSSAYSFGTIGCNLRCANCQNFDISQMFEQKGKTAEYVHLHWGDDMSFEEHVKKARSAGCQSIAYTYNEPTVWTEYALDTMMCAHKSNVKNVWVSNGFMTKGTLHLIIPHLDAINVDIKFMSDSLYKSVCGARLQPILDNCVQLRDAGVWLEITTLVIPGYSDDEKMLRETARFIKKNLGEEVPWHVSAFSGSISWKMREVPNTSKETIQRAYEWGKEEGLLHVYAGNVWDTKTESTYCPKCDACVVQRTGYSVEDRTMQGSCPVCKHSISGVWRSAS